MKKKGMEYNYQEALAYLEGLNAFGIKPGLSRIRRLLELLDHPEKNYRAVHVTGTNGKGSVSAMLAAILRQSGIKTGLYTSPHLVSYTERMRVDGEDISEADFAACARAVKSCAEQLLAEGGEQPTQFEVLTAMAFLYFAECSAEYAVIEVGLGGLLDSTNVIVPDVSVITNVAMEHADRCGGTLLGIAHHKAGIIKEGVPLVTAADGEPLAVIEREAAEKQSKVFAWGRDFSSHGCAPCDGRAQEIEHSSPCLGGLPLRCRLPLLGEHQIINSAVAVTAAKILARKEPRITDGRIRNALAQVEWPGRFERMDIGNQCIVVDGAHNPAGMTELRKSLDAYFPGQQRVFLLGILKDKDIASMLRILLRAEDIAVITAPQSERTSDPAAVAASICAGYAEACADNAAALDRALALAGQGIGRLLCVAGSLYLIGGIRQMLLSKKAAGGIAE